MPQLEKYMFFNQIWATTVCLLLLFAYLRRKMIPRYGTALKYRSIKMSKWDFFTRFWHMRYIMTGWFRGDKGKEHLNHIVVLSNWGVKTWYEHFRIIATYHALSLIGGDNLQNIVEKIRDLRIDLNRLEIK